AKKLTSSGGGSISLQNLAGEQATLTGGAGDNTFAVTNWTGTATLDGKAGADKLTLAMKGGTVQAMDLVPLTLTGDVTTSGTATITGALGLGSLARTFTVSDSLVISAVVSGSVGLTKLGTGTLKLTGNNTYTGTTTLKAGILTVNGTQPSSKVTVADGRL